MLSDSELIDRLRQFLSTSDLNTTTTATVRRQLEADFGIDLSDRKAFIREQVDLYLQDQFENAADNEEGEPGEQDGEGDEQHEEEGEQHGDEGSTATTKPKSSAKKRSRKIKEKESKKRGGGFNKLCSLSPELQKFTGVPELARTEVVKQLWIYIREYNLQDPSNRRNIVCDDKLRNLFGVDTIDMFQMNKALAKHIWPLDSDGAAASSTPKKKQQKQEKDEAAASSTPKKKQQKQEKDEDDDEPKRKDKQKKGGNSAFLAPLKLSDALVKFLGTGESQLPRSDVVKRMWAYIKQNNLQDPTDKRQILCDEKLKELLNVDTFCGFTVAKLLTDHLTKIEQ